MTTAAGGSDGDSPWLDRLWRVLFPSRCLGCGTRGEVLCTACRPTISYLPAAICYRCALPTPTGNLCARCQRRPAALDSVRAACTFEGVVRKAIHMLKYRQGRYVVPFLGSLLEEAIGRRPLQVDVIVPVPLSRERLRERGYNQSQLLAGHLSRSMDIPMEPDWIQRTRPTPPQTSLSAASRRANVRGAFQWRGPSVEGKRVLLVDDVMTTGATLEECGLVVRHAGARRVLAVVVARDLS